jgi:chromosome segregation ATPase
MSIVVHNPRPIPISGHYYLRLKPFITKQLLTKYHNPLASIYPHPVSKMNIQYNTMLTMVKRSRERDQGRPLSSQIYDVKTQMPQYHWPGSGSKLEQLRGKKRVMEAVRSSVTSTPPMGKGDENTTIIHQLASENIHLKMAHAEQELELAGKIYELKQQLQAAQQNHTPNSGENDESLLQQLAEKNQQLQQQLQAAQQQQQAPNQKAASAREASASAREASASAREASEKRAKELEESLSISQADLHAARERLDAMDNAMAKLKDEKASSEQERTRFCEERDSMQRPAVEKEESSVKDGCKLDETLVQMDLLDTELAPVKESSDKRSKKLEQSFSTAQSTARQRIGTVSDLKSQKSFFENECNTLQGKAVEKKETTHAAMKMASEKRSKELAVDLEAALARINSLHKQVSELKDEKSSFEQRLAMHNMDHGQHCERSNILDMQVLVLQEQNQLLEKEKAGFSEQRLSLQNQLEQKEEHLHTLRCQYLESSARETALENDLAVISEPSDNRSKDLEEGLHNRRLEQEGSRERIDSPHVIASKTLLTHQLDQASAREYVVVKDKGIANLTGPNASLERETAGVCNKRQTLQTHFVQHQKSMASLRSQIQEGDTRVAILENELTFVNESAQTRSKELVLSMQKADLEVLNKLLENEYQRSTDLFERSKIEQAQQKEDIKLLVGVLSETKRKDQIVVADLEKELEGALSKSKSMKGGLSGAKNSVELLEIEIDKHTKRNSSFLEEFNLRVFCEQRLSLQKQLEQKQECFSTLERHHLESSTRVTALESDLAMFQESSGKRSKDLEEALHNRRLEQEVSLERVDSLHDIASKAFLSGAGCA